MPEVSGIIWTSATRWPLAVSDFSFAFWSLSACLEVAPPLRAAPARRVWGIPLEPRVPRTARAPPRLGPGSFAKPGARAALFGPAGRALGMLGAGRGPASGRRSPLRGGWRGCPLSPTWPSLAKPSVSRQGLRGKPCPHPQTWWENQELRISIQHSLSFASCCVICYRSLALSVPSVIEIPTL